MIYSTDKDINCLVRQLVREGWGYQRRRKHGRLISPDGKHALTIAGSPSDCRSFENFRQDVRKIVKGMTLGADDGAMELSRAGFIHAAPTS